MLSKIISAPGALLVFSLMLCLVFSSATGAQAQQKGPTPSVAAVKSAIARLLKQPIPPTVGEDIRLVLQFAEESDKVLISVDAGYVAVTDAKTEQEKAYSAVLLGYYIAGAVRYDLANPAKKNDAWAEKPGAVRAEVAAYRAIRKRNPAYKNALMDKFAALEKSGKLDASLAAARRRAGGK